jgi:flavin reductase (DIM6/NTAB) family NADH-FMN oxidoreductase RutF
MVYDKMRGIAYQEGPLTACPLLDQALVQVECEVHELLELGDHAVAVGRVLSGVTLRDDTEPLTNRILGWSYAG